MYSGVSGAKFWLLGIVTFGIYPLIVWCKMVRNLNAMASKVGGRAIRGYIAAILLGCVTCGIYTIVWLFKFFGLASRLNAKANAGVRPASTFPMLLMSCIPIYSFFWVANMNNKLANAYEQINRSSQKRNDP